MRYRPSVFIRVLLISTSLCASSAALFGDEPPSAVGVALPTRGMFSPTKRELQGTAKSSPRVWPGHPVVGQPVTLLECVRNVSDVPVYVFEVEGGGPNWS